MATSDSNTCVNVQKKLEEENLILKSQIERLNSTLDDTKVELEREIQKRCDLEGRFTDEANLASDQIKELITKLDKDDEEINDLKLKCDEYSRLHSSMVEKFVTDRETLNSHILMLREENEQLTAKILSQENEISKTTEQSATAINEYILE